MMDIKAKGLLFSTSPTYLGVESLDELVKSRRKRERQERRQERKALKILEQEELEKSGERFLNAKFNTKRLKEEFINNLNKEKIIESGLSDIIQKGVPYPGVRFGDSNKAQQRVYESLSQSEKKMHHNYLKALSIMVLGDSFLVESWKSMFLLDHLSRQGKIKFKFIFLGESKYRVWKLKDNEESSKWLSSKYETKEVNGNIINKTKTKLKKEVDGNK
jgi:hypothetical protein